MNDDVYTHDERKTFDSQDTCISNKLNENKIDVRKNANGVKLNIDIYRKTAKRKTNSSQLNIKQTERNTKNTHF